MVRVGVLGVGFMGKMHFNVHRGNRKAKLIALSDLDPAKLAGDWSKIAGNIADARAAQVDLSGLKLYGDPAEMFGDPEIDLVDITLPTFLHAKYAIAALEAGKHVVCEKPMALTLADCDAMIAAAEKAKRVLVIAHCIRFWPEWMVLKQIVDGRKYGKVQSATFWRRSATPLWSWDGWLLDEKRSGGALVDLHIHDIDYVNYVFGVPKAVSARGVVGGVSKSAIDSVATQYFYDGGAQVTAEGSWTMAAGFGFDHGFLVSLEGATVEYDLKSGKPLTVHTKKGKSLQPKLPKNDGYVAELRYFVDCIGTGKKPSTVTAQDGRNALAVALAEGKSVRTGEKVAL
jgi:predicted dehydrogenase